MDTRLQKKTDELMAIGMSRERAEQAAAIELGLSDGDILENSGDDDAAHAEDEA